MRAVIRAPAFLAVLLLAACAHAPAGAGSGNAQLPAAEPPTAWFPLSAGNSWTWVDRSPSGSPGKAPTRTVRIVSRDADRDDGNALAGRLP